MIIMAIDRNEFTKRTRDTLAKRAGQKCSNPYCSLTTVGPHTDENKNVDVGEAAHIRGAKYGSKRYDPTMTPTERRNITNGVWLCRKCAKLIDSDEFKYSIEILHEWKRNHEAKIARNISGQGWQRELQEKSIKVFADESSPALQIALDQPTHWEFLLTVELLRAKLGKIKRDFDNLKRGLIFKPTKTLLDKEQLRTWIQEKLFDLSALINFLSIAASEELTAAWGEPGQPGNAIEILNATNKIAEGCNWLLLWEIDLHFTRFPDGFESIKYLMEGWTEHIRLEMDRVPNEISKIFTGKPKPEGRYEINLVFEAPKNIDEIIPVMEKLW